MIASHLRETAFLPGRASLYRGAVRSRQVVRKPVRYGHLEVRNFGFLKDLGLTKPSWLPSFKKVSYHRSPITFSPRKLHPACELPSRHLLPKYFPEAAILSICK